MNGSAFSVNLFTERMTLGKSGFSTEKSLVDYKEPVKEAGSIAAELKKAVLLAGSDQDAATKAVQVAQDAFHKLSFAVDKEVIQTMIAANHADVVAMAADKSYHPELNAVDKILLAQQIVLYCLAGKKGPQSELEFGGIVYRATEILKESETKIPDISDPYLLEVFTRYALKVFMGCKSKILKVSSLREMEDYAAKTLHDCDPRKRQKLQEHLRTLLATAKQALSLDDNSRILAPAIKGQLLLWFCKERDKVYLQVQEGHPGLPHTKPPSLESIS